MPKAFFKNFFLLTRHFPSVEPQADHGVRHLPEVPHPCAVGPLCQLKFNCLAISLQVSKEHIQLKRCPYYHTSHELCCFPD